MAEVVLTDTAREAFDHNKCHISTGICESVTAGQGKLDANGYFEYPCLECAGKVRAALSKAGVK